MEQKNLQTPSLFLGGSPAPKNIPEERWEKRNFIWDGFDKAPIVMDELGWFDVIPYKIANHVGKTIELVFRNSPSPTIVVDLGCGCGGSTVGLAKKCVGNFKILGIDNVQKRLDICKHNCELYKIFSPSMQDVQHICRDIRDIQKSDILNLDTDKDSSPSMVIFTSPPRSQREAYATHIDSSFFAKALELSEFCVLHIPYTKNLDPFFDILESKKVSECVLETIYINGHPWGIMAYTGSPFFETKNSPNKKKINS